MIEKYKYYIKLNENDEVINSYSDGQRQPDESDICVAEGFERSFSYNCYDKKHYGVPLRKYDRKTKKLSLLSNQEKEDHFEYKRIKDREEIESLISQEMRNIAVESLKEKGVLDKNGNLNK